MLCKFCLSILAGDEGEGTRRRSAQNIEMAALSNCYVCYWLLEKFMESGNDADADHLDHTFEFRISRVYHEDETLFLQNSIFGYPLHYTESLLGFKLESRGRDTAFAFVLFLDSHVGESNQRNHSSHIGDWGVKSADLTPVSPFSANLDNWLRFVFPGASACESSPRNHFHQTMNWRVKTEDPTPARPSSTGRANVAVVAW
jgi:hypothetical protein